MGEIVCLWWHVYGGTEGLEYYYFVVLKVISQKIIVSRCKVEDIHEELCLDNRKKNTKCKLLKTMCRSGQ
jgi:hypothetical protein